MRCDLAVLRQWLFQWSTTAPVYCLFNHHSILDLAIMLRYILSLMPCRCTCLTGWRLRPSRICCQSGQSERKAPTFEKAGTNLPQTALEAVYSGTPTNHHFLVVNKTTRRRSIRQVRRFARFSPISCQTWHILLIKVF
ncbi:hypothetical protein SODALDRAFT_26158 [Sodiomyces alkalinus F11]|uniref:Uncharacterized protein n=1 Tax=Sodiomyces alkalinus (strain CBS 110278 / VKM F-3762 / F11) TaxID=1314773 RepID=A0A3N2Q882_SODAK|nr:hypothetical protein SODALDRAFT_26158 [Sodiomyces alkalinus F11]ROT42897.1 hypothetical protein SODALDRAFT_26158 [Sodiomyces alkalinus F11]